MAEIVRIDAPEDPSLFEGCSCAFGVFDGVHRGHRFLMDCARRTAAEDGGISVAITFSIDPDELFAPDRLVKLMSNEERIDSLARTGVDAVAVLPFDRRFAALGPDEFLDWAFGEGAPAHMHVGSGFRFGARGAGTAANMGAWRGGIMKVHEHELVSFADETVSATRIRKLLAEGDRLTARELLGEESYSLVNGNVRTTAATCA